MDPTRCWRRLAPAFALAALVAAAPAVAQDNRPAPAAGRQGYSIFRETLVDMPWPEVQKVAEAGALVLLPVGVIEEHGPHMGLGADTYLAYHSCAGLKRRLADRGVPAVVVPPVYWGVMQLEETGRYPGSFTVRASTMQALLYDVLADLQRWGFRNVFLVNYHGDRVHLGVVAQVTARARDSLGLRFFDARRDGGLRPNVPRYLGQKPAFRPDYHAGMRETAEMVAFFPEEVDVRLAATLPPENGFHPRGYAGDPANHVNYNGRSLEADLDALADALAAWVKKGAS